MSSERPYRLRKHVAAAVWVAVCVMPGEVARAAPQVEVPQARQRSDFVIELNGVKLRMPRDYIGFATTEAQSLGDTAGVAIHALLPNLSPDTGLRLTSDSLFLAIDLPMRGSAAERLEAWKVGNKRSHVGLGQVRAVEGGGRVTVADVATATSKTVPWDMFEFKVSRDGAVGYETLFCGQITGSIPWSRCRDAFVYQGLLVQLTYHKSYLPKWQEVRAKVIDQINAWTVRN